MDPNNLSRDRRPEQAEGYYKKGIELKASGQPDRALTEFRRAVLADPSHAHSHLEIGLLTKSKAAGDPYFMRYAFDAFRNAARLDPNNEQAHDQYIMVGQKMGLLDELHREYDGLAKANPDNLLFQRCAKNIVTLSLALIPEQVHIATTGHVGIRKILLFTSLGLLLFGAGLAFGPLIANKMGQTQMDAATVKRLVMVGFLSIVGGMAGFFARGRLGRS